MYICSVENMLNFFGVFSILTNILQFYPGVLLTFGQYTCLDRSIINLLSRLVHFMSGVTKIETVLFCLSSMFSAITLQLHVLFTLQRVQIKNTSVM